LHIAAAAFGALETNLYGLIGLYYTVVRHVGSRVRIVTCNVCIPAVGNFASIGECESDRPTIDSRSGC
jgi:hypothetical protein